jgi:hypothetical protein
MGAANPIERKLIDNLPIADLTSDTLSACFNYAWELQIVKSGANGNPLITLEVSMDEVNWDYYHLMATGYELSDDSVTFFDDLFAFKHFRISVLANGTTAGNITATIFLKDR